MSLFESTLTRWTTEMIEPPPTRLVSLRIHSIVLHSAHVSANLDGVVVSDPLAYRIERLGREI